MRSISLRFTLAAGGIAAALLIAEAWVRVSRGSFFSFDNFLMAEADLVRARYPAALDPLLGWRPARREPSPALHWTAKVNITADGIRSNGDLPPRDPSRTILAVGDSFTFGDDVADHETWPAVLERTIGVRVINGGVFAYGIDQSFLRLEQLLRQFRPEVVLFGMIPNDIVRCGFRVAWGMAKPWYVVENGELQLRGVPVSYLTSVGELGSLRGVLGYSALADEVVRRVAPQRWTGSERLRFEPSGVDSRAIGCLLMRRLSELAANSGVPIRIVLQNIPGGYEGSAEVLECARAAGIVVFDLIEPFLAVLENDKPRADRYWPLGSGHLSPAGNEWAAALIAAALERDEALNIRRLE